LKPPWKLGHEWPYFPYKRSADIITHSHEYDDSPVLYWILLLRLVARASFMYANEVLMEVCERNVPSIVIQKNNYVKKRRFFYFHWDDFPLVMQMMYASDTCL